MEKVRCFSHGPFSLLCLYIDQFDWCEISCSSNSVSRLGVCAVCLGCCILGRLCTCLKRNLWAVSLQCGFVSIMHVHQQVCTHAVGECSGSFCRRQGEPDSSRAALRRSTGRGKACGGATEGGSGGVDHLPALSSCHTPLPHRPPRLACRALPAQRYPPLPTPANTCRLHRTIHNILPIIPQTYS